MSVMNLQVMGVIVRHWGRACTNHGHLRVMCSSNHLPEPEPRQHA